MTILGIVLLWTLILWVMHWLAHKVPFLWKIHRYHHETVAQDKLLGYNWRCWFIWIDNWGSTADQWVTEVIPTLIFCFIFGCWWLLLAYWVWSSTLQEVIRHNPKINLMPWLPSGRYHLVHHTNPKKNYGAFTWLWDWVFRTYDYKK